ncbi:MAG: aminotransferase class I/II-fold pyridoxal phosphate-dependent enzyme [Acetobacteraceae bacterium]|nr:aminotransferase class I/II-fold pyridoxal phosphate-dependent enzyme [Acetobacteraceae bacterium]
MTAPDGDRFGLSPEERTSLIERLARRRTVERTAVERGTGRDFSTLPLSRQLAAARDAAESLGLDNPYFREHEGRAGARTRIAGREVLNFASYDYLGLNGHPAVVAAAKEAIDRYGVSTSASRLVAGERPAHRALEERLAALHGAEAALVFVSGHATTVSTIATLCGARDLILHDSLIHNSALLGAQLSGARRLAFPHNDWAALDDLLAQHRRRHDRALVVVESLYSMDGDVPDLVRFREVTLRHDAWLMVDEAHGIGVLGPAGRGIAASLGRGAELADIWMGTLSKTLAACGGWIAGSRTLIEILRYGAGGFVYSVGLPPVLAAAASAAIDVMLAEPERAERLRANGARFLAQAKAHGLDTGTSAGLSVVPVITRSSIDAAKVSARLLARGINVLPILAPAVPEEAARLRFFLTAAHTAAEIDRAVEETAAALAEVRRDHRGLAALAARFGLGALS